MPTLLDYKSKLLRDHVIARRVEPTELAGPPADGPLATGLTLPTADELLAKHFRLTISRASLGRSRASIPHVKHQDVLDAPAQWTDWFVHSHNLDMYVMFVSWFYFFQTVLQTLDCFTCFVAFAEAFYDGYIGIIANLLYALFYASFLLIYLEMQSAELPRCIYICGIVLYTAGYVAFAVFGIVTLTGERGLRTISSAVGSWCFVAGLAAIAYALMPDSKAPEGVAHRYSGFSGSLAFLIGSVIFTSDAMGLHVFGGSDAIVGYLVFTIGRVFFIKASTTAWCSICFRKTDKAEGVDDSTDSW